VSAQSGRLVQPKLSSATPAIVWVREVDHIRLIDRERGLCWKLTGIEAAIWDLLVLAYPFPKLAAFLAALHDVSVEEAKGVLLAVLATWQHQGILEFSDRDGQPGD